MKIDQAVYGALWRLIHVIFTVYEKTSVILDSFVKKYLNHVLFINTYFGIGPRNISFDSRDMDFIRIPKSIAFIASSKEIAENKLMMVDKLCGLIKCSLMVGIPNVTIYDDSGMPW